MGVILGQNNYGKSRVRLVKVTKHPDRHDLTDLSVDIQLQGDFLTAHTAGDNSNILPTDTMKNTVYALAKGESIADPENFGLMLAAHFLGHNPQVSEARIELREHLWRRIDVHGKPHRHSFISRGNERRLAVITQSRAATVIEAGIEELLVLKTTDSGFVGYIKDPFTTLKETTDRIFSTVIAARWRYTIPAEEYGLCYREVRRMILETFAQHHSLSVQQTLYAAGKLVLDTYPDIAEIRLSLPNRHCLLVNLTPFGMEIDNEIFVPTDEPHGLIEATITRDGR
jgi:urate oxidase